MASLEEQKAGLERAIEATRDYGVRSALEIALREIDKKLTAKAGKKTTLADGTTVGAGSTVWELLHYNRVTEREVCNVGSDATNKFDTPAMTHRAELAKYEAQQKAHDVAPPSPDVLARRYLQKAGYKLDELAAVQPLLDESENKGKLRNQMVNGVY